MTVRGNVEETEKQKRILIISKPKKPTSNGHNYGQKP